MPSSHDFVLSLDGVSHYCTTSTPPIVLLESGAMTSSEFNELWPLLLLMVVTAFGLYATRKMLF
jgi:hypothetical protein